MSLVDFLYRYIFRGIGILILAGVITALALAILSQHRREASDTARPVHATDTRKTR